MDNKSKAILAVAVCFLVLGILAVAASFNLGKLMVIACDVGQEDGLLLITLGGDDIVIDGGPGSKIADCLSRYMPFWDRTCRNDGVDPSAAGPYGGSNGSFCKLQCWNSGDNRCRK